MLAGACARPSSGRSPPPSDGDMPSAFVALVESVRNAAWLAVPVRRCCGPQRAALVAWARTEAVAIAAVVGALAIGIDLARPRALRPGRRSRRQPQILARIAARRARAVAGREPLPQHRAESALERRPAVASPSARMFAFELFFYVDVLPVAAWSIRSLGAARARRCAERAAARRSRWCGTAIGAPTSASRTTPRSTRSPWSRAAIFLLAVAVVGALFRRYGGAVGPVLQVTSLFGSAVVLATVLSSETARSRHPDGDPAQFLLLSLRLPRRVAALHRGAVVRRRRASTCPSASSAPSPTSSTARAACCFSVTTKRYRPTARFGTRACPPMRAKPADGAFVAGFRGGRWIQELAPTSDRRRRWPPPAWLGATMISGWRCRCRTAGELDRLRAAGRAARARRPRLGGLRPAAHRRAPGGELSLRAAGRSARSPTRSCCRNTASASPSSSTTSRTCRASSASSSRTRAVTAATPNSRPT